jgi:co-chaperonin GroES (HSP10)
VEPEKKSAWKDEPKEAPIEFRDVELEKAIQRTAEIKAHMSPPGALKLPELLEAQRLKWGIPDGAFKCRAVFDRIHIFPIDFEDDNEKTSGGLYVPDAVKQRSTQGAHRGILISMGLEAADKCVSHGIELGHIVRTIRNAPHAQECMRLKIGTPMYYLVMRAGDLTGSETQEEDLRSGKTSITDEGGEHSYCYQIDGRKKRGVFINDSW